MAEKSDQTIHTSYHQALKLMKEAESKPRGNERQNLYLTSRRLFEEASNIIDSLSLFSSNESIDDIATVDLKFLLIPAYLAKIMISIECEHNRLETFKQAKVYALKFFKLITQYGLGNDEIEKEIRSDGKMPELKGSSSLHEAMRSRDEKIANYKRRQQLDEIISELERRIETQDNIDDEVNREYYMKLLQRWIEDSLDCLKSEINMGLIFEANRNEGECQKESARPESKKSENTFSPKGALTIVKDNIQKQVYGLGYPSRPTVTVDEFISQKIEKGDLAFQQHKEIYSNSLQRYAEQPNLRRDQEEEDAIEAEKKAQEDDAQELERKRRWDEFKDENPRGSGNRHNMG